MWKVAVFVPKAYLETRAGSATVTLSEPVGQVVQTPSCLVQNEHVQARAGIADGSGVHVRANDMLPQWHLPVISMTCFSKINPVTLNERHAINPPTGW
jgi:hypothetical protein